MDFCIQLAPYLRDRDYGGAQLFADATEQARLADAVGFEAVSVTEHHLINILLMPAPLQLAVRVADRTQRVKIITSVAVLPLHDMRIYAGEVISADILTEGRLMLGVGRGAFAYEMERLGVTMAESRRKFDESLDVLQALLSREEVCWDGEYYRFDPLTVMPRPISPGGPEVMMAVMNPEGIAHCTRRGFHIMTTPLAGNHALLVKQVDAFRRAVDEGEGVLDHLTLSLSRVTFLVNSRAEKRRRLAQAGEYYARFENVYTGPGEVQNGMIAPLPRAGSLAELDESLAIGSVQEVVDQLGLYQDLGLDRFILSINIGASQAECLEHIQQFAEEVMPHFAPTRAAAE